MIIIEQNDGQLISKRLIDFTTMQLIQLVQLENEKIVGALTESSIIIWSLHINQLHIEYIEHNIHKQKINSICSLSDNRIVSCSNVQIIIVLNGEPPYEIIIQIDLSLYHLKQCKVLKQINENYIISSLYDSTICVWDLRIYQLVTVVENKTDNSKQDYFYAFDDNHNYKIYGYIITTASTGANTITAIKTGKYHITFKDGTEYSIYLPTVLVKGITIGKRLFNY